NPNKLIYYDLSAQDVIRSIRANNNETGGSKFEMSGVGYIIKTSGYLQSISEIENLAVKTVNSIPVRLRDLGSVQMSSESRLGIFDLDGEGEVVGGIVVMRYGENASDVIEAVKKKMQEVAKG